LYFFRGGTLELGSERFSAGTGLRLTPGLAAPLRNGAQESEVLLLQARPIAEPVAQRGPFVMNDAEEIVQAYRDYRRTGFGGWPWQRPDPVHERSKGRFAIHADGREERATQPCCSAELTLPPYEPSPLPYAQTTAPDPGRCDPTSLRFRCSKTARFPPRRFSQGGRSNRA